MFEKEAKRSFEELDDRGIGDDWSIEEAYENGFSNGSEFGYNKAKVEVEDSYRESLCNSELNLASVTEQLEELEKANEWHFVKDGLPEELHDVLCFVIHNEHRFVLHGYLGDGRWVLSPLGTFLNNKDVIAWKEIVFPKEIENA